MATRWVLVLWASCVAAWAEFVPDRMEQVGTNVVWGRPIIVSSNWFFAAGYVASGNRGQVEKAFVYARPRPGAGKAGQWIAPVEAGQEFGMSMAFEDGALIVK